MKDFNYDIESPRMISNEENNIGNELDKFFLGGRSILGKRIAHLLVSSSFGANAILYAAWLGYVMGFWAVIIQVAWCISFLLIYKFAKKIYSFTSLHDFLGYNFGKVTQKIGALCSIIGLLYFAGWEIAIAKSGLESLNIGGPFVITLITSVFIIIPLIYSSFGGQKINSIIDTFINIAKFLLLIFIVVTLTISLSVSGNIHYNLVLPPFSVGIASLGMLGLITNLIFNLSWQFVDNSTWQTISSTSSSEKNGLKKSLFGASSGVFLTVALLGTLLGSLLAGSGATNITSDNILGAITIGMLNPWSTIVLISICALLLLSMMTLVDGVSLSVAQSVVVDMGFVNKKYMKNKKSGLKTARIITVLMGALAAWGVQLILKLIGGSIFDFVYILIVAQLSLLGPIIIGLVCKAKDTKYMWLSIVFALFLGIISSALGAIFKISALIDLAGSISALSSVLIAYTIYSISKNLVKKEKPLLIKVI